MGKRRLVLLSIVVAVLSAAAAYAFSVFSLIRPPATPEAESIDWLLKILFAVAGVLFVLITSLIVFSLIHFRQRNRDISDSVPMTGHKGLEILWTVVPLVIVSVMAVLGGTVLGEITRPGEPDTELQVNVLAFQWGWQFEYPNSGVTSFELRLPVDRRVVLNLTSRDVVHSFWVPEFGPKEDAVPGMVTQLRLTPHTIGEYRLECAELCGFGHTFMLAPVHVTPAGDFENWLREQQSRPQ